MRWHMVHQAFHLDSRDPAPEAEPSEAFDSVETLVNKETSLFLDSEDGEVILEPTRTIKKRSPKYTSPVNTGAGGDSGDSGGGGSTAPAQCSGSNCPVSGTNNTTLPIVLGVVIPIVVALTIFVWLHRRNRKKQRMEDANDKHGSLDFGLGEVNNRKKGKKGKKGLKVNAPEMTVTDAEKELRRGRGLSLDMSSPYLMPGDIKDGRRSFNDMSSRGVDDPYSSVSLFKTNSRSPSRPGTAKNDASIYTRPSYEQSNAHLLGNMQKPSHSSPPNGSATATPRSSSPTPLLPRQDSSHSVSRKPVGPSNSVLSKASPPPPPPPPAYTKDEKSQQSTSNFSLPKNVDRSSVSTQGTNPGNEARRSPPPPMPRKSSKRTSGQPPRRMASLDAKINESNPLDDYQTYADVLGIVQAEPNAKTPGHDQNDTGALPTIHEPAPKTRGLAVPDKSQDNRRLSASLRPLPPEDPTDNAEQRANRIRSFYREYFDDSNKQDRQDYGGHGDYYEDYGQEYLNEATIWDPETGQFVLAGGQGPGMTRRAMTPPPRGPPRFRGAAGGHRYTSSSGQSHGRPRAFSSTSGRPVPGGRGRPPKRPLPPPKPLTNLPTPHLLQGDMSSFSAIDFAPPPAFKEQRAGRSASPRMDQKAYSPPISRGHTPLTSSYQDLASMPSPHSLRKSSTFTGLDFAPPPRFRDKESGSDSGSIRSGRSNVSANIRAGAYRLSRVPKEQVGTRDDLATALHPKWDLNR